MSDLKDLKNMTDEERREAVMEFGQKIDATVGEKFRTVRSWFFRLFGGLVLAIGIILMLCGVFNGGLGTCGAGILLLGLGLGNISMRVQYVVAGTGIILLGAAFVNYGFDQRTKAKESVNWPSITGKILNSEVEKRTSTTGTGSSRKTSTTYVAVIKYEYTLDGTTYTSDRIAFGGKAATSAGSLVNKYPKAKSVNVYYNPDDPKEAALETGLKNESWFFPGFGAVWMIPGVLMVWKGIKSSNKASA